ncbi:hypothetical protein ACFWNK_38660, partial [Streptomyces sp. NPDC058417]|uniref:hypothetical protein n=1 Tax=unclassified Streptomyces TaxID=2593676 RepID=UPI003666A900
PPTNPSPDRSSSSASTDQHHNKISPTLNQPWAASTASPNKSNADAIANAFTRPSAIALHEKSTPNI